MLLKTHFATAAAIAYMFDYYMCRDPAYAHNIVARIVVYATAILLQQLIDQVGHTWKSIGDYSYPARNMYHSLPAMLLIGLGVGAAYYVILGQQLLIPLYVSVMAAHWLEDLVTEGGVYLVGWRRLRLPRRLRIRYDNPVVNRLTVLVCMAIASLYTHPFASVSVFFFFMVTMMLSVYSFLAV